MPIHLAYYGDDFTGSTDVMDQLVRGGLPTVLFTEPPRRDAIPPSHRLQAVGVAGRARAQTPQELEASLPSALEALAALRSQFVHYKVSSTFDSSPGRGSIGRAIELAAPVFKNRVTPLVVGAPALGRYCVFGNLFARSGLDSPLYRLDRHPTMSRHPSTPMDEADVRVHLARQTDRPVELIDALTLDREPEAAYRRLMECPAGSIVLFDVLAEHHLIVIGRVLAQYQRYIERQPLFIVGSSGVDAALARNWQDCGVLRTADLSRPAPVDRLLAISGSCSPVTARQIARAVDHGFVEIPLNARQLLAAPNPDENIRTIAKRIQSEQDQGRSVIVHTSRGACDADVSARLFHRGLHEPSLGTLLGRLLGEALRLHRPPRVAIAGGDTASDLARAVGVESLDMVAVHAPGAPLCRAHSSRVEIDGLEFTFKGGQVGHDDYFVSLLRGT